jgi:hypothetical protein
VIDSIEKRKNAWNAFVSSMKKRNESLGRHTRDSKRLKERGRKSRLDSNMKPRCAKQK